jgi:transcriptional regulator with XRE-family HTH domain
MTTKALPDHDTRPHPFAENLSDARLRAGLSQEQLADRASVDRAAIGALEHGRHEPNLNTIVKLARALEVPAAILLRGL